MTPQDLEILTIGPEEARAAIKSSPGNRKLRKQRIQRYASDMRQGKWSAGADAILFDQQGRLRNGHHRMYAVILAGAKVPFIVRRNVPERELLSVDGQEVRTLVDAASFDKSLGTISNTDQAIAKMILILKEENRATAFSNETLSDVIRELREAIDFVNLTCFDGKTKKKITMVPVLAAFVKAYYTQDRAKLKRAADVLMTGIYPTPIEPGVQSLLCLRDHLLALENTGSGNVRRKIYASVQNMLNCYLKGESRLRATGSSEDFFPVELKTKVEQFPNIDPDFLAHLRGFAATLDDLQIVTPRAVAEYMLKNGYDVKGKAPEGTVAGRFAKNVTSLCGGELRLEGIGSFKPHVDAATRQIRRYVFLKEKTPAQSLKDKLRAA
jgi:hypothetical protein